tara:strand:- start:5907 stop:7544 length:1638 start_codon:yes stop_codon:yes gene_type:complete
MDAKSEKIAQNILKTRKETRKEEKDILELRERALGVEKEIAKTTDFQSVLKSKVTDIEADIKRRNEEIVELEKEKVRFLTKYKGKNKAAGEEAAEVVKKEIAQKKARNKADETGRIKQMKTNELAQEFSFIIGTQGDKAKAVGDGLRDMVKGLPGGDMLVNALGIETLGNDIQEKVIDNMLDAFDEGKADGVTNMMSAGFSGVKDMVGVVGKSAAGVFSALRTFAMANPITAALTAILVVATAVFKIIRGINKAARELGDSLDVSRSQAVGMLAQLKGAEMTFKFLGLDSSKLKTTLGEISDQFGSLAEVNVMNAMQIERMAQNMGVAGTEVVKFNKVMTDLTGMTFDQATNTAKMVGNLAISEGVAAGKVLKDIADNSAKFAEFTTMGAEGLAQAAVEAAKVGTSISSLLTVADGLLSFEQSITAEFEAQVLTGKALNLETARRLALEGNISGLQAEIQKQVGNMGDIQSMNVIERRTIASAIGLSVQELMAVSRGESIDKENEQIELDKKRNDILRAGFQGNKEELQKLGKSGNQQSPYQEFM